LASSRRTLFLLLGALIALAVVVALALQRETGLNAAAGVIPAATMQETSAPTPPPLTAEEEAFIEALWPLHQSIVEPSAGRLASAGIAFAIDDHDANRLVAKLTPLRQTFHDTREKIAAIAVPASMQPVRDRYLELLRLYEQSATEMEEVARDGDEGHLITAQEKSEHAGQELVKVTDILWPEEHKPN
jgi:hypothetical protein